MIVRDGALWSEQQQSLRDQGDEGVMYLEFLELWADSAEQLESEDTSLSEMEACRRGLLVAEERFGKANTSVIGQMLALLVIHWQWGEEMIAQMSSLESRMMEEALIAKLEQMEQEAKVAVD